MHACFGHRAKRLRGKGLGVKAPTCSWAAESAPDLYVTLPPPGCRRGRRASATTATRPRCR